jgi:hypothetical protein
VANVGVAVDGCAASLIRREPGGPWTFPKLTITNAALRDLADA